MTDCIIIQTTDVSSSGEVGDNSCMIKENDIEDMAISDLDKNMGNVNKLPEAMILFNILIFELIMLKSFPLFDICIPISQLLRMKQLLTLMQKSPVRVLGW